MLRVENLSVRVGDFALRDVSLKVAQGEYFVLMGPNGAGKTLLLRCIGGLLRVEGGRILIGGRDVTDLEPRERDDEATTPVTDDGGELGRDLLAEVPRHDEHVVGIELAALAIGPTAPVRHVA